MSERENASNELLAFLAGAAAGAVVALLLAPRSGQETRERVGDWVEGMRERGEDLVRKGSERIEELREKRRGDGA